MDILVFCSCPKPLSHLPCYHKGRQLPCKSCQTSQGKRARLKKELVTLSVGKWREDELRGVQADLGITDGEPEIKGIMARTQPGLPSQRCLFHAPRDLYWALYRDGAQGEWAYWEERLRQELWKPSAEGMAGMDCLIAELDWSRFHSAATYLILGTPKTSSLLSPG